MMTKKFLVPFVLASLAGHALVLALTTRIDWTLSPPSEQTQKVITVDLKAPPTKAVRRPPRRSEERRPAASSSVPREGTAALQGEASPYRDYLLQVRRKIEQRWSYPPQALADQEEGNAVIRFTIDANGDLSGYRIMTTSGSAVLDQGALAVVKAAAPYAPLPAEYNLSRLHITATFSYRMGE
jgi:periplasmic protein TonB